MKILSTLLLFCIVLSGYAQKSMPEIFVNEDIIENNYLPDFSFAGYHFGEKEIPSAFDNILNVIDFGAVPNDNIDDTDAFISALQKADKLDGFVLIKIPSGRFDLSRIIHINRSHTVIKGAGAGLEGTLLHYQRPLRFVENTEDLSELREYLVSLDKRQREPENGVDILFSQYSWSGGYFWVGKKGARVKPYLPKYNQPINSLALAKSGQKGHFKFNVDNSSKISIGDTYKLCWFNKDGKKGSFLKHLYDGQNVKIGSHHWTNPESPLVNQIVKIVDIIGNTIIIKDPLLHDLKEEWHCSLTKWEHIEEVGIENLAFEFPVYPDLPHHCEDGNNAIYLTSLMNGWVRNVRFKNADSGVLTDDISNVTIENIRTHGDKLGHYSVAMGEVHNVLVKKLKVENNVRHPLSFNTRSTKSVYTNCEVEQNPILDQHSGANEQNLFDNIKININSPVHQTYKYPLFMSGGAGYWAPAHGAFSTFYNIGINFENIPEDVNKPIVLNGVKQGVSARIIGVHANHPVVIEYSPNAYIENTNLSPIVESLYEYQFNERIRKD